MCTDCRAFDEAGTGTGDWVIRLYASRVHLQTSEGTLTPVNSIGEAGGKISIAHTLKTRCVPRRTSHSSISWDTLGCKSKKNADDSNWLKH